ncbi:Ca2+-binding RTX toxin-like protein [Marmoricola sp. OAE513]|uniref:calcium-binding protein n=1 Tax=Marmoricola sp. OAE513 TaxID=2817894 RepID=UPI001AEB7369
MNRSLRPTALLLVAMLAVPMSAQSAPNVAPRQAAAPEPTYVTDIAGLRQVDGIDIDPSGNVYASGRAAEGFRGSPGAYDRGRADGIAVVSLDPAGQPRWAARIGGASGDYGESAGRQVIDSHGNVYLLGSTEHSDLPTTAGALGRTYWNSAAGRTTFLIKFGPGGKLVYSARIPGSDQANGLAVDSAGAVYVVGTTSPDFVASPGAFDSVAAGDNDAYVAKIAPNGSSIVWSSLLGGSKADMGVGVALAPGGGVVVSGETWSNDFPTTPGAPVTTSISDWHVPFATKLAADGKSAAWSTYVPAPTDNESNAGVKVASDGRVGVLGFIDGAVPPTPAGQPVKGGSISQISADGTTLTRRSTVQFAPYQGLSTTPAGTYVGFGKVSGTSKFNDVVVEIDFDGDLVRTIPLAGIGLRVASAGGTTYVAFDRDPYLRVLASRAPKARPRVLARYTRCTIRGTARKDVLRGTPRADVICGLGGKDKLIGGGGADVLIGGSGKDKLYGGSGVDVLIGGSGRDKYVGGSGRDVCRGAKKSEKPKSCLRR